MDENKNKLLIDGLLGEEIRIAYVDEKNDVLEYNIHKHEESLINNIYVAKIVEIKPSIDAAFVVFDEDKTAFLPFENVHPSNYIRAKKSGPIRIENVLRKGQLMIVQILKNALENKSPVITTYVNLAGKNCIFLPNDSNSSGISKKIIGETRVKFKGLLEELDKNGGSLIIRTASHGATIREIRKDYNRLAKLWANIKNLAEKKKKPGLIYEQDQLLKLLRTYSDYSLNLVQISGPAVYEKIQDYVQKEFITFPQNIEFCKHNVFEAIEPEIAKLYQHELCLKSGGSIIIHQTEAMVSIDVNSKSSVKDSNLEQTAFNTNKEAVELIAKQVMLRNLSGLIVIDCIDMQEEENIKQINKLAKDCFKNDKSEVKIFALTSLSLLQISRRRQNSSILVRDFEKCSKCNGFGYCMKEETSALNLLRKIIRIGNKNTKLQVSTSHQILQIILNKFFYLIKHYKINWRVVNLEDDAFGQVDVLSN